MKKLLWSIGMLAPAAALATTLGVSLKENSNKVSYVEIGKRAFNEAMEHRVSNAGLSSEFVDQIPKDENTVTFIFQRAALTPLTEMISYALLSNGPTYIDNSLKGYNYDSLVKTNPNIILSHEGVAPQRAPAGWEEAAKKAKFNGKKINILITAGRLDDGAGDSPFRTGNEIFKLADNVIELEDGSSNAAAIWNKEIALGVIGKTITLSDNFYSAVGNLYKNNDYSRLGYSGAGAPSMTSSLASNFLPKFKMYYSGASTNLLREGTPKKYIDKNGFQQLSNKSYTELGFGNIDQSRLAHELFSKHPGTKIVDRPFKGLRNFFGSSKDMISDINAKRDGRKIYMMLGTYCSDQLSDNFKNGIAQLYLDNKDKYQIFWKGHPDADAEGTWIRDVFMKDGWMFNGKLVKPTEKDLIILNPEVNAETLYDLRTDITDVPEFTWDAYGTVNAGARRNGVQWTSAISKGKTPWDRFADVIWTAGPEALDHVTPSDKYTQK